MYHPAPRPLMLVSQPALLRVIDVASLCRAVSETQAPLRRGQRGSDGGSLQGAASHNGQCDVTAGEVAIGEAQS